MSEGNGGPQPQAMPQIGVLGQYVKDLSFENPNAPRSITPTGQQPSINIQVNVDAAPIEVGLLSRRLSSRSRSPILLQTSNAPSHAAAITLISEFIIASAA